MRQMALQIRHRGPDDEDIWLGDGVGFAHRRLAVIDPSPHGRQPMSRAGRWTISFNGEIYNYRELRRELSDLGETFLTDTDTEVLIAALVRWGEGALNRLNGMFAFALWDSQTRRLLLARDRIGKKPLFYARIGDDLVFGSEIKAILPWQKLARTPDLEAIHHYLSLQYVPAPMTAFASIRKLPAGSLLEVVPGKLLPPRRYWDLPPPDAASAGSSVSAEDLADEARERLTLAVRRRMVADVPVGAFLSGGIDSSTVTALMAHESSRPVKTFSIGFEEAGYDERPFAKLLAERYGTEHHEDVVRADAASVLPALVWHYGEPFADPSAMPTFYLSRLARQHVTVALSGDGGDEFFLGYDRYAAVSRFNWVKQVPNVVRRLAGQSAAAMPDALARVRGFRGARQLLKHAALSPAQRYEPSMMFFHDADKREGYGPALAPYLGESTTSRLAPFFDQSPDMATGAAWADIHTYLPDDLLVKVDVASMAFGLEVRAPFLDVDLMEWASKIPAGMKLLNGELKGLLKKAVAPLLPDAIVHRPKMGFGAPVEGWLRGEFFAMARDLLTDSRTQSRGLFRRGYAEDLLEQHRSGRRLHHTRIWAMLMLELWFRAWIDADLVAARAPGGLDLVGSF